MRPEAMDFRGACDTHMHLYDEQVPHAESGPPLPGHFDLAAYRKLQDRLGLQRVVLVQPNAYQFDNQVLLRALGTLGDCARGVAVVSENTSDAELRAMTKLGVRGQRFYALKWGALGLDAMPSLMPRLHEHGWHANVQLDGRTLPDCAQQLLRLPGAFVLDHVGKFLPPVAVTDPAFKTLLKLLDSGRCWIKLSAPYESSKRVVQDFDDVGSLVQALAAHAPERCLWASNWPHPFPAGGYVPDDVHLFDLFRQWLPDTALRHKVLVSNPATLYGFDPF